MKQLFFMLVLVTSSLFSAQGELWFQVKIDGVLTPGVTIRIYYAGGAHYQTANTLISTEGGNAWAYFVGEPARGAQFGPMSYNTTYYVVIGNRYLKILIGDHDNTPDGTITCDNGNFTFSDNGHGVIDSLGTGNWDSVSVNVQNSFGSGSVKIDYVENDHNTTKYLGAPTFPHRLRAIDNQTDECGVDQKFNKWTGPNSLNTQSIETFISTYAGTYLANFDPKYIVAFVNSHPCATTGGPIEVDGDEYDSPTSTFEVISPNSITGEAINHSINHISFTFTGWNQGGGTTNPYTFTPSGNTNYIAFFEGTPTNGYRNQRFNSKVVGQPIKVYWDQHPNTSVTKYKVYRKPKYGSESCVATVNRTGTSSYTYTFTDPDMVHTNSSSSTDLYYYDVRAYYSPSDNYSDYDFKAVYAEMGGPIADDSPKEERMQIAEKIYEYGISNYPNPYNPTTTISYSIKEQGNVQITVYDALGRKVADLVNEIKQPGSYNAVFNGSNLTSGIYFYTMKVNDFMETKKMLLTK